MSDTSKCTNPAILHYRGLDLEAITALQMRNVEALRSMTNLMFDTAEVVTRRQAEFLKSHLDQMSMVFEPGEGASDPKALFERQAEAYRDLFEALTSHIGEFAQITSNCCDGLLHEASRAAAGQDEEGATVTQLKNDSTAASKTSTAKK